MREFSSFACPIMAAICIDGMIDALFKTNANCKVVVGFSKIAAIAHWIMQTERNSGRWLLRQLQNIR